MRLKNLLFLPLGFALLFLGPEVFFGQTQREPPFPPSPVPYGADQQPGMPAEPPQSSMEQRAMKELAKRENKQRQADLKRDTDQLLKLATQLKEYVDKTNENILSVDVINKAEQIEKLAHSVKEKMKGQ